MDPEYAAIISPSPLHRPRSFLELPHELIISMLSMLEVLDILRARQVCRQLHEVTRESYLWLQVLQRRIPEDALGAIRTIDMMGHGAVQLRAVKTCIWVETCHFIPGARWLLTISRDHSIHAWDSLAEDVKPIMLWTPHPDESVFETYSALDHIGGGNFTLVTGKSNESQYQINIFQVTIKEDKPLLSEVGTISCPQGYGRVFVSGNCIARFLDRRVGYAECFRWDQFLSGQPFGYAALNISLPTNFVQPTNFLPGGRLICSPQQAIMVFKFPELQMVDQLGEKYPQMVAIPIWWFSSISLSWLKPAMKWSEPAQLSPSSSFPTFLRSFSLLSKGGHVFRLSVQDDTFKVDQLSFPNCGFVQLGPDLGFVIDGFYMTFLQVVDGQVVFGERLRSTFFHVPHTYAFDEIFGNVCFVKSPSGSSDKTLEFFV